MKMKNPMNKRRPTARKPMTRSELSGCLHNGTVQRCFEREIGQILRVLRVQPKCPREEAVRAKIQCPKTRQIDRPNKRTCKTQNAAESSLTKRQTSPKHSKTRHARSAAMPAARFLRLRPRAKHRTARGGVWLPVTALGQPACPQKRKGQEIRPQPSKV